MKVGSEYRLMSSDEHVNLIRKHKRDPADCRPDIVHQSLMALMDSPLNKAGLLKVFIHTQRDVLIEVSPLVRIPRTFKRFAGLMVQLLHKLSIRASGSSPEKLFRVIKNPVTKYLPTGAKRVLMSASAKSLVNVHEYVEDHCPSDAPTVFVVGGMAKGQVEIDYADEEICISNYNLSAACVCSKLTDAFENYFDVL